jgi:hypothetical protein
VTYRKGFSRLSHAKSTYRKGKDGNGAEFREERSLQKINVQDFVM